MKRLLIVLTALLSMGHSALGSTPDDPGRSANSPAQREPIIEWEIVFDDGISTEEYALQLDYFKIEVAAISKKGKVEYISNVASPKPAKRTGQKAADYRMGIGWKRGNLHAADRKLLAKAGINSDGKELWHYFPIETQTQMEKLQHEYANRETREIKRTRFAIRPKPKGAGYEFVVLDQDPPKPRDAPSPSTSLNKPSRP